MEHAGDRAQSRLHPTQCPGQRWLVGDVGRLENALATERTEDATEPIQIRGLMAADEGDLRLIGPRQVLGERATDTPRPAGDDVNTIGSEACSRSFRFTRVRFELFDESAPRSQGHSLLGSRREDFGERGLVDRVDVNGSTRDLKLAWDDTNWTEDEGLFRERVVIPIESVHPDGDDVQPLD